MILPTSTDVKHYYHSIKGDDNGNMFTMWVRI